MAAKKKTSGQWTRRRNKAGRFSKGGSKKETAKSPKTTTISRFYKRKSR